MKTLKDYDDIEFQTRKSGLKVSELIVMASAAGWYVGQICEDPDMDGLVEPYDRLTHYVATPEEASRLLLDETDPEV